MMWTAYGYSRRLKGKAGRHDGQRGARLCCLSGDRQRHTRNCGDDGKRSDK